MAQGARFCEESLEKRRDFGCADVARSVELEGALSDVEPVDPSRKTRSTRKIIQQSLNGL